MLIRNWLVAGGFNMKLKDFLEESNFETNWETLPKGDTFINLEDTEIESLEVEFDGQKKTRYKLKTKDKEYLVGVQVMKGIQENKDSKRVRITKTGEGKQTHYTVVAVLE